jgi:hypothetical protein
MDVTRALMVPGLVFGFGVTALIIGITSLAGVSAIAMSPEDASTLVIMGVVFLVTLLGCVIRNVCCSKPNRGSYEYRGEIYANSSPPVDIYSTTTKESIIEEQLRALDRRI